MIRGKATENELAEFSSHLATGCPSCTEEHQWLSEIIRLKTADVSFDVPEELIQWTVAQFKVQSATFATGLRQLLAQLIFDTLTSPLLSPVRSDQPGSQQASPRQLLYRAEGYHIDLRFERTADEGAVEIVGQIMAEQRAAAPYCIRLMKDEIEIGQAVSDATGMFLFTPAPAGKFDLKVEVPEGVISIQRILNHSQAQ
jgi:hypothetical protein